MKKIGQKDVVNKAAQMVKEAGYENYVVGILEPKDKNKATVSWNINGYKEYLTNLLEEMMDEVEEKSTVDSLKQVAEILDDILGKDK